MGKLCGRVIGKCCEMARVASDSGREKREGRSSKRYNNRLKLRSITTIVCGFEAGLFN